jgi:hypothetical protein
MLNPSPKSDFEVKVVRIGEITKHPGADTLDIIKVFDYPVVSKTGSFKSGDLAVYVPVDAMVPTERPSSRSWRRRGRPTTASRPCASARSSPWACWSRCRPSTRPRERIWEGA